MGRWSGFVTDGFNEFYLGPGSSSVIGGRVGSEVWGDKNGCGWD